MNPATVLFVVIHTFMFMTVLNWDDRIGYSCRSIVFADDGSTGIFRAESEFTGIVSY